MTVAAIDVPLLLPALAAGLLVLTSHLVLGQEVLKRGIVFLDLAIAQCAGLGLIAAHRLVDDLATANLATQVIATASALAGALILYGLESFSVKRHEALIGCCFAVTASLAMLLISHDVHGAEQLQDVLVGQILWSSWQSLLPLALLTMAFVATLLWQRRPPTGPLFYLWFAVLITQSVQVVGIYLVFASLIIPALVAEERRWLGPLVGVAGYGVGLVASALYDLPAGASIVVALASLALVATFGSRIAAQR